MGIHMHSGNGYQSRYERTDHDAEEFQHWASLSLSTKSVILDCVLSLLLDVNFLHCRKGSRVRVPLLRLGLEHLFDVESMSQFLQVLDPHHC